MVEKFSIELNPNSQDIIMYKTDVVVVVVVL